MRFSTARRKFRNNWMAFSFTDTAKEEGKVIAHDKDRHKLFKKLKSRGKRRVTLYVSFTGNPLPTDAAIILFLP